MELSCFKLTVIVTLYLTVCTIPHTCYEPNTDPRLVLGIDVGELVEKIRATTSTGTTIIKYQLEHCGVPVLGCSAILEVASDGKCRIQDSNITPEKVEMLPRECAERHGLSNMQLLEKVSSEENDNVDLERVKEQYDACSFWLYRENPKEVRSIVYLKYISGGFTGDGGPKRKSFQVDVNTYEILKREVVDVSFAYEMTGIGGNLNLGKHQYGNWEWSGRKLLVDRPDADGLYCNMENHYLAVADAGGTGNCDYNDTYVDLCNSYSMLNSHSYNQVNDVLFYSTNFLDMLKDDYFDTTLPAACGQMYTCVNIDFDNAFYGSCEQFYGSGKTYFWGLGSADVVAHELCHGVTQFTSNLVYSQETGGMNEAFSDMCGITYKTYLNHGHNDWKVGYGIIKDYLGLDALRFMDWPPADGVSIQCQADYYDGMDVHYSSGLYNKVFYLLATTPGWSEKKAFQVFLRANQFYWTYVSSFNEAACGVLLAASTFSYSVEDVEEAFAAVGIFCDCPPGFIWRNNHSCYKITRDLASWAEAKTTCEAMGAVLAVVENEEEFEWIQDQLQDIYLEVTHHELNDVSSYWIGASDQGSQGQWKWLSVSPSYTVTYLPFALGEPNNQNGFQRCISMTSFYLNYYFHYRDEDCQDRKYFLCEKTCKY